jgi:hypothetical protein
MTQTQQSILWIGILVVLVFLFTDQNFRNEIFNRGSSKTTATSVPYTASQVFNLGGNNNALLMDALSGIPSSSSGTTAT